MPIKWKKSSRFQPAIILKKVDEIRTVNPQGGASFKGFDLGDCLPALHSMLDFPESAKEVDVSNIVWSGLAKAGALLNPETFLAAANKELSNKLSTKIETYKLLTTISLNGKDLPKKIKVLDSEVELLPGNFPKRFASRNTLLQKHKVPILDAPKNYTNLIVTTKAKSPSAAASKGLRALDTLRALWCLMANPRMQLSFGTPSVSPINVIRLGGRHTLHAPTGKQAMEGIWFDPVFHEATLFRTKKPTVVSRNVKWALHRITTCPYGESLSGALVRYVRALDEKDPNSAFLRLWGAVESLATPRRADYEALVRRCAFLFEDSDYHRQLLEHLREYRNASVHAGEESDLAKTHCFQLQLYFVELIWFHIRNSNYFLSFEEAIDFFDLPQNVEQLQRRAALCRRALKFIGAAPTRKTARKS